MIILALISAAMALLYAPAEPVLAVDCDHEWTCEALIYPNGCRDVLVLSVGAQTAVWWEELVGDGYWGVRLYFSAPLCGPVSTLELLNASKDGELVASKELFRHCVFLPFVVKPHRGLLPHSR